MRSVDRWTLRFQVTVTVFAKLSGAVSLPVLPLIVVAPVPSRRSSPYPRHPRLSLYSLRKSSAQTLLMRRKVQPYLTSSPILRFRLFRETVKFFTAISLRLLATIRATTTGNDKIKELGCSLLLTRMRPNHLYPRCYCNHMSQLLQQGLTDGKRRLPFTVLTHLRDVLQRKLRGDRGEVRF